MSSHPLTPLSHFLPAPMSPSLPSLSLSFFLSHAPQSKEERGEKREEKRERREKFNLQTNLFWVCSRALTSAKVEVDDEERENKLTIQIFLN